MSGFLGKGGDGRGKERTFEAENERAVARAGVEKEGMMHLTINPEMREERGGGRPWQAKAMSERQKL